MAVISYRIIEGHAGIQEVAELQGVFRSFAEPT